MTDPPRTAESDDDPDPGVNDVYDAMEPLEPYTTGEIATRLDAPRKIIRTLLNRLAGEEKIRKKEPEPERVIWIRDPPKHECPGCGGEFGVRYFHPVFQAAQFCPRCGTQLRKQSRR